MSTIRPPLSRRAFGLSLAALLGLAAGTATADSSRWRDDDDSDHEEVWRARERGEVLPLDVILERLKPRLPGRIIEIEFEVEDGVPVYEFKTVDSRGRVIETLVDARDARILEQERD